MQVEAVGVLEHLRWILDRGEALEGATPTAWNLAANIDAIVDRVVATNQIKSN